MEIEKSITLFWRKRGSFFAGCRLVKDDQLGTFFFYKLSGSGRVGDPEFAKRHLHRALLFKQYVGTNLYIDYGGLYCWSTMVTSAFYTICFAVSQ